MHLNSTPTPNTFTPSLNLAAAQTGTPPAPWARSHEFSPLNRSLKKEWSFRWPQTDYPFASLVTFVGIPSMDMPYFCPFWLSVTGSVTLRSMALWKPLLETPWEVTNRQITHRLSPQKRCGGQHSHRIWHAELSHLCACGITSTFLFLYLS